MAKKAVITILGLVGHMKKEYVIQNGEIQTKFVIKKEEDKAKYYLGPRLKGKYTLTKERYINMLPVICEIFSDEQIIPIYTEKAKTIQQDVLVYEKCQTDMLNNTDGYIEDEKAFQAIFARINSILKKYDKVIVDITHGFRHLPILMTINLIVENIQHVGKIEHLLFAKENEPYKEYEIIDLKEYLDISNIALVIRSFLSTFKVPDLQIDYVLYDLLKDFSIHLTSNQFREIFENDIPSLQEEINLVKNDKLYFLKELLEEIEKLLLDIKSIQNAEDYEKFIYFSKLFVEKDYLLHSSTYLIEGITHYLNKVFDKQKLSTFDAKVYGEQQKLISLLRLNYSKKDFNFPHPYFVDINIEVFNELNTLRENIAEIRHNLAHINISKTYGELKRDIVKYIKELQKIIEEKKFYNLETEEVKKIYTVKYILEQYASQGKKFVTNDSVPKLETLMRKYQEKTLENMTGIDLVGMKQFLQKNSEEINRLFKYKDDRQLLLPRETARGFDIIRNKILRSMGKGSDIVRGEEKIMPNGEVRVVKSLKKRKPLIKQSEENEKLLKKGASVLADKFNKR